MRFGSCWCNDWEKLCSFFFQDATVDDAVLRKKEQKDVELDKKILALRKKNEALIRRYQVSLLDSYLPHLCFGVLTALCMKKTVSSVGTTWLDNIITQDTVWSRWAKLCPLLRLLKLETRLADISIPTSAFLLVLPLSLSYLSHLFPCAQSLLALELINICQLGR